jgi:transcriptional regulator with XRE-family HTH domain
MTRFDPEGMKAKRARSRLTQRELGALCGVSHQTISYWETGSAIPSANALPALATALDCGIRDLYTQPEVNTKALANGDQRTATV